MELQVGEFLIWRRPVLYRFRARSDRAAAGAAAHPGPPVRAVARVAAQRHGPDGLDHGARAEPAADRGDQLSRSRAAFARTRQLRRDRAHRRFDRARGGPGRARRRCHPSIAPVRQQRRNRAPAREPQQIGRGSARPCARRRAAIGGPGCARARPHLPPVLVDGVQIQQVVLNLVRNAIEAMEDCDRRELGHRHSRGSRDMAEISVADTGPGIAPELADRLFQPFVTTKKTGMGLGLSICREIVEAHHGRLTTSPRPEGGTVFRLTLTGDEGEEDGRCRLIDWSISSTTTRPCATRCRCCSRRGATRCAALPRRRNFSPPRRPCVRAA